MSENIAKKLPKTYPIDSYIVAQWMMYLPTLYERGITKQVEISPAIGYKYRFDLFGLLANEFNVTYRLLIPNMLVNGYNSPTDYDGTNLRLYILDESMCGNYIQKVHEHRVKK